MKEVVKDRIAYGIIAFVVFIFALALATQAAKAQEIGTLAGGPMYKGPVVICPTQESAYFVAMDDAKYGQESVQRFISRKEIDNEPCSAGIGYFTPMEELQTENFTSLDGVDSQAQVWTIAVWMIQDAFSGELHDFSDSPRMYYSYRHIPVSELR
jgi:hypothetical protein